MSSAILYVAIVVIWACVLIPRWLRRDASVPVAEDEAVEQPAPASLPGPRRRPEPRPADAPRAERRVAADEAPADLASRRVRSARRRLLLMLVGLSIASGVLAGTKMAAWWVVVPPSVMLLGYLLLLREAAKADAERRAMAERRAARADRAPVRRRAPVTSTPSAAAEVAAAPAVSAEVASAKVITIPTVPEPAEEGIYDQYADAKLRAVGD